jgi:hypothetical protein
MRSLESRRWGMTGTRGHARALLAAALLAAWPANAHFKITSPASWMSQDTLGGPQKNGPCAATPNTALGDSPGTPTNVMNVEQAGATISVTVDVTIAHPGWFRVALAEGASSTQTLTTIPDPVAQAGTNCTPAIMTNPVWSPTQPVIADGLPAGSTATTEQAVGTHTFPVTIPAAANCTSDRPCALQVIMMMTDHPKTDCYYHHCADIAFGSTSDSGESSAGGDAAAPADGAAEDEDASESASGRDAASEQSSASSATSTTSGTSASSSEASESTGSSSASAGVCPRVSARRRGLRGRLRPPCVRGDPAA